MFKGFSKIIENGQNDGSIRNDLDAEKTTYSLAFITTGFFHSLSETGKTFTKHFNLNMDDFVNYSIDLLLSSIKAD